MQERVVENRRELIRVPPHDIETEEAILCGILNKPYVMLDVLDIISADDFYREANNNIFEAMAGLYGKNESIDLVTISDYLNKDDLLEKSGGKGYLMSLIDVVSISTGIIHHCHVLKKLSIKRKLINYCNVLSESCFQYHQTLDDLLDQAEKGISDITNNVGTGKDYVSLFDAVKVGFKRLECVAESGSCITGLETGFKILDDMTSGLQQSDLIILAGRPSMGKTALALNIAENVAKDGKIVAVHSIEMSTQQLSIRMLGSDSKINAKSIRTGLLKDNDWIKLSESANKLGDLSIYLDETSAITPIQIKTKCRKLQRKIGLDLVIIDYLQLMRVKEASREREIAEISRSLKGLAKELNVPVLALSQLNRKVEDRSNKKPQLADLRESGAIEQDADVIIFIYRDEVYHPKTKENSNKADIIIAKQRNGPTGQFKLTFLKEITRFENYSDEWDEYDPHSYYSASQGVVGFDE